MKTRAPLLGLLVWLVTASLCFAESNTSEPAEATAHQDTCTMHDASGCAECGTIDCTEHAATGCTKCGATGHTCPMHSMHGGTAGGDPRAMMEQFTAELGLTGQQQQDIQIIMSDYAERFRDLAELSRASAEELLSIEPTDPTYAAKTDEASATAATSAAETVVLLSEMRAKLYAVLTAKQRETLRQKIEAKRQEMEQKKLEYQQQHETESHDRPMSQFIG